MNELIDKTTSECYSKQQIEYLLFEFFLNHEIDDTLMHETIQFLNKSKELKDISKLLYLTPMYKIFVKSSKADVIKRLGCKVELSEIEDTLKVMEEYYNHILDKTKILANELKISNSLELSILFSYMLYNGYYSKTKEHKYKLEDRKPIYGFYSYDIFNGNGVCLNYSDMLTDILRFCGYEVAIIANMVHKVEKPEYKMNIDRGMVEPKLNTKIFHKILGPISHLIGNHACTLIIDNGRPYIYDPTNLTMFDCVSNRVANHSLGKGEILLKPYLSYAINDSEGLQALRDLAMTLKYDIPYNKDTFIRTSEKEIDKYNQNIYLFDCFHDDIKQDINTIVEKGKILTKSK